MKKIEQAYQSIFGSRYEVRKYLKYFTHEDFKDLKAEKIAFPSDQGQVLRGNIYYYQKSNKLCLFSHGMDSNHKSYMHEIAYLARSGQMVFAYDNTGVDTSEGESLIGFTQSLIDLDFAIRYIKHSSLWKDCVLSCVGHSWGAFACLNIVGIHEDIAHIVAISPVRSSKVLYKQMLKGLGRLFVPAIMRLENKLFPAYSNLNLEDALNKTKSKILLLHCRDDEIISCKKNTMFLEKHIKNSNIEYFYCNDKNHNPNYTKEGVQYMKESFRILSTLLKNNSEEEVMTFAKTIDFKKIVVQDKFIMNMICTFIK